jgi:hypothetical protein
MTIGTWSALFEMLNQRTRQVPVVLTKAGDP